MLWTGLEKVQPAQVSQTQDPHATSPPTHSAIYMQTEDKLFYFVVRYLIIL